MVVLFVCNFEGEYMEGLRNEIPLDMGRAKELSESITQYRNIISSLRLWLMGCKKAGNEVVRDENRRPVMNEEGANYFCNWCEEHTAAPIFFTRREHNDAVGMILDQCETLRATIAEKFEDWDMDFNYAEDLVLIFDSLASAALYGSIGGFTLQRLTEHLMVQEIRGNTEGNRGGGMHLPNIFKRGGNRDGNE